MLIKVVKLRKLGVLGIIILSITISFLGGSVFLYSNSYSAASTNTLSISRGGTNANTEAQAAANILGENFDNFEGIFSVAQGGAGANNTFQAQTNLNYPQKVTYSGGSTDGVRYIKVSSVNYQTNAGGKGHQVVLISGVRASDKLPTAGILITSGRDLSQALYSLSANCSTGDNFPAYYIDLKNSDDTIIGRDYYIRIDRWAVQTSIIFLENDSQNAQVRGLFTKNELSELDENYIEVQPRCYKSNAVS
ncbi:MAG: hypothetical protein LBT91_01435 [Bifidobacteriaceae bacterium]|jgi:hypothetical protein|nr:hypothetical protein [Bifidobacteriaceae bacterium]